MSSGLDARYMISKLRPTTFEVVSLTTIATPHQGQYIFYFLHHIFTTIWLIIFIQARLWPTIFLNGWAVRYNQFTLRDSSLPVIEERLSQLYFILGRLGLQNGAFKQLTRKYLAQTFNPDVVNVDNVKYKLTNAVPKNASPVQLADIN